MIRLSNLSAPLDAGDAELRQAAARALERSVSSILTVKVARWSVDARDKRDVRAVVSLDVTGAWSESDENRMIRRDGKIRRVDTDSAKRVAVLPGMMKPARRPLVVGAGPAGMFAALRLAQAGWEPIVWERGKTVEERAVDVALFQEGGRLDPESNVQFGEGGAGAFSDGKLTTGIKDPRRQEVLDVFAECGAPEEILILAKPHVGTDRLPGVVKRLREMIIGMGGTFSFRTRLAGLRTRGGAVVGARGVLGDEGGGRDRDRDRDINIEADRVVLAIGHSARDTLQMLRDAGIPLQSKPFAVGVRIEHSQAWLNRAQYGAYGSHPALGAADYKLAAHLPDGTDVYTFCVCPGGTVVAASSEPGGVALNGMSKYARDGINANGGVLVALREGKCGDRPLDGLAFQRGLEEAAFRLGGGNFRAPAQRVGDFLRRKASLGPGMVAPTYPRGVEWCELDGCLPVFLVDALREGLRRMDRMLPGFAQEDAVLTGVESRSSSPVRIVRDGLYQTGARGLYVAGEGAGYAGGIVSAAVDGLRAAEAMIHG
ncbi:MAG: hypothetical protein LBS11_01270 [Oscillospiraceae bacterium]|jgi:uncharacterized FAD-dependent dehydrogenase|nr:hypothetical protein [Oscillospiraceae bacterium]